MQHVLLIENRAMKPIINLEEHRFSLKYRSFILYLEFRSVTNEMGTGLWHASQTWNDDRKLNLGVI